MSHPPTTSLSLSSLSICTVVSDSSHFQIQTKRATICWHQTCQRAPFFPTHYVPISCSFHITCSVSQLQTAAAEAVNGRVSERNEIRLDLPNKGRMAAGTLDLLKDCQLPVKHVNPRQYVAQIPQVL
ncbi:ATP phosphoribosyltransferase 2 [Pyrus ussuriensis x Pyrus communis]|uniref:ATP phosphoribosyltransferase 2 n=1 Tax=Pyrus ussuriensis x Pyrus communis TaxID=2448454 RepID=A0A5N5H274_9ROSA|nr:ATP phosphoribosyltransferase 2 [Pyrus ussuriensis x Pyrus communis]